MSDVLTKEQRHRNMSNIRSKDTKIECILRKDLWSHGIRYRKNYSALPGKPDIVIKKYMIAIFCDIKKNVPFCVMGNSKEFSIAQKIDRGRFLQSGLFLPYLKAGVHFI